MSAPACRVCGCTDEHACNPPCAWFEPTLCTTCALAAEALGAWSRAAVKPSIAALLRAADIERGVIDLFNEAAANIRGKTPHEIVHQIAAMMHERVALIQATAAQIGVRVEIDGHWENRMLSELPAADALREGFRLLLRAEGPQNRENAGQARV